MSFITKIGDSSGSNHKLSMMRKKYFRNISDFNQVWQQQKKQQEVKTKIQSHRQFNKIVNHELQALEVEKQYRWNRKINNQEVLKDDYQKQMTQRVVKKKEEKQIDRQYARLQDLENDKFMERRMIDFMKIYDRNAVKNSTTHNGRRIKTQADEYNNPESMSHQEILTKRQYLQSLQEQSKTNPFTNDEQKNYRSQRRVNGQVERQKRQFEDLRHKVPLLPSLEKQKRKHIYEPDLLQKQKRSRSTRTLMTNNVIF